MLVITHTRLIDGISDSALEDVNILTEGERIKAISREIPPDVETINGQGKTVIPGLIELGARFSNLGHINHNEWELTFKDQMRERILPVAAQILLESGVTTARYPGGNEADMYWLKEAEFPKPRPFIAGAPLRKIDPERPYYTYRFATSPNAARQQVRDLVSKSADFIKVVGDQFTHDELTAIVAETHLHGLAVDISAHDLQAIRTILSLDVGPRDLLYHVMVASDIEQFPEDIVEGFLKTGIVIVPTVTAVDGFREFDENPALIDDPQWKASLPADMWTFIRRGYDRLQDYSMLETARQTLTPRLQRLRQLYEAGVCFHMGTDSGNRCNPHHRAIYREFEQFLQIGLSPMEALKTATSYAAVTLGRDDLGRIVPGALADVVMLDGNPLDDLRSILQVHTVIQAGNVVSTPDNKPTGAQSSGPAAGPCEF